jgi:hypothetical protein
VVAATAAAVAASAASSSSSSSSSSAAAAAAAAPAAPTASPPSATEAEMDHHLHQQSRKQMASPEVAMAGDGEVFDQFCNATTLKSILGHFRHLCDLLKIKPTNFHQFYPKLKSKLRSWKAQALWKKFDQRANHKCYNRGKACLNTRVSPRARGSLRSSAVLKTDPTKRATRSLFPPSH